MNFQRFFHCCSSSAASASVVMPGTKDDHGGGSNCHSPRYGVKKWSMTVFSFILVFMACVTFMAEPVSALGFGVPSDMLVITLYNSDEICGQTLNNPGGYVIADSFYGDIECDGSGPIIDGSVLDCAGNSIIEISGNDANGLELQNGSTAKNCVVKGFLTGIFVSDDSSKSTVTDCMAYDNFNGIYMDTKAEVAIVGGEFSSNRFGIHAYIYGATPKLTVMDVTLKNNKDRAIFIRSDSSTPVEITGVIIEASEDGVALEVIDTVPEVTCSDIFGKIIGEIDDSGGGVCMNRKECGGRTKECETQAPPELAAEESGGTDEAEESEGAEEPEGTATQRPPRK